MYRFNLGPELHKSYMAPKLQRHIHTKSEEGVAPEYITYKGDYFSPNAIDRRIHTILSTKKYKLARQQNIERPSVI